MKTLSLLMMLISVLSAVQAQEASKRKLPLFVSHLPEQNRALLRRKEAPRHTIFSKVICFKKKCRAYIGWRTNQRSHRFKGYKDGGKVPRPAQPKQSNPVMKKDTVVIAKEVAPPPSSAAIANPIIEEQKFTLDDVLFEINSATLNDAFTYRLDSLVELLQQNTSLRAEISGHTDNTGSEAKNLKLSKARAKAVADYRISNRIQNDRLAFEGYGSSKPITTNNTETGRQKNRRVEILLTNH